VLSEQASDERSRALYRMLRIQTEIAVLWFLRVIVDKRGRTAASIDDRKHPSEDPWVANR